MVATASQVRILMIRAWTEPLAPIRAALRRRDLDVRIRRVDFEPALTAALARDRFDLVVFDPETKELPLSVVHARVYEHGRRLPIVRLGEIGRLGALVTAALVSRFH